MHKYMRAIGFADLSDRKDQQRLITDVIVNSNKRSYTTHKNDNFIAEFCKEFAPGLGISVCGEFDEDENFTYDYYYPYLVGNQISSVEDITVERHAEKESYAGICDDLKIGVSLIFYLQNMVSYVKALNTGMLPIKGTTLSLSGLSIQGTIVLPLKKDESDVRKIKKANIKRAKLLAKARGGDEEAIETLTVDDMDTYTAISNMIHERDILSLVDSYFMPYGVECDHYSIMGDILDVVKVQNSLTNEMIWRMTISINEMCMDVCINERDLFGEPKVGRRFKGIIWLQGAINYPEIGR